MGARAFSATPPSPCGRMKEFQMPPPPSGYLEDLCTSKKLHRKPMNTAATLGQARGAQVLALPARSPSAVALESWLQHLKWPPVSSCPDHRVGQAPRG